MSTGVGSLHLVSAAAPLETGDHLEAMAGKQVFKLAKAAPAVFVLLSYWQGVLARLAPNALFKLLFGSAAGADVALAADREFRAGIIKVLKACFIGRVRGYARDIGLYVQPWEATLAEVAVNTYIWHGAEDNWAPPQMAEHLKSAIPGYNASTIFNGLSHYSCLHQAARGICNLLRH
jgi:pimeloyl-ACP methyl ester carboxylesterase